MLLKHGRWFATILPVLFALFSFLACGAAASCSSGASRSTASTDALAPTGDASPTSEDTGSRPSGDTGTPSDAAPGDAATPSDAAILEDAIAVEDAPVPLTTPALQLVAGRGNYPRAITTMRGHIVASVVAPQASGRNGGTLLRSVDDGVSFSVIGHIDPALATGGLCCATLFELPKALGALPAGTLLWAAAVGANASSQPMSILAFRSSDEGVTWSFLSTVVVASVPPSTGGLWEPEFSMLADGRLVCHYSDETETGHSQVLAEVQTQDGLTWSSRTDTVALANPAGRPGMANVRIGPGNQYFMSYEVCGTDACKAHLRISRDGWNWGDPTDAGILPTTVDGHTFEHAPTLAYSATPGQNGRLYMVGQMVYPSDASTPAPENGRVLFANTEGGLQNWYEIPAPVPVAVPPPVHNTYDCPNYSSSVLPLDNGIAALEIAARQQDDAGCSAYFARGPL